MPAHLTLLQSLRQGVCYLWAFPGTMVGLAGVVLSWFEGGHARWVEGVLEVTAPRLLSRLSRVSAVGPGIQAITLGHVVIGRDRHVLQTTRQHERVHVRQYERWGPAFIPAYLLCSAWLSLRGFHPYLDNPFEIEAFAIDDPTLKANLPPDCL